MGKSNNRTTQPSIEVKGETVETKEQATNEQPAAQPDPAAAPAAPAPAEQPAAQSAPIDPPVEAKVEAPAPAPAKPAAPAPAPAAAKQQAKPIDPPAAAAVSTAAGKPALVSVQGRLALAEFEDYVTKMEPVAAKKRTMSATEGANVQAGLHRALLGVVNAPADDFNKLMAYVLSEFHARKDDVFSDMNVFTFMAELGMPAPSIKNFRYMVNMFKSLADPATRNGNHPAKKQVDFKSTLDFRMIPEASRQRVQSFFGV